MPFNFSKVKIYHSICSNFLIETIKWLCHVLGFCFQKACHFLDPIYRRAIPCTPDYQEINWEKLYYSKNIPTPFKSLRTGLTLLTLLLVIVVQIGRKRISLVVPLNQPKDLQSILPLGYFLTIFITYVGIKTQ